MQNKKNSNRDLLLEEAPLFAGLDDFVLIKTDPPKPETSQKEKAKTQKVAADKKATKTKAKKAASPKPSSDKAPNKPTRKPQTVQIDPNAILLSVTEMCSLLKISRATLVRMDNAGKLPGRMKIGGSVRFHRGTVETWLNSMVASPPAVEQTI